MIVSHVLVDDVTVLARHQCVVIALAGLAPGLLDVELVQQSGYSPLGHLVHCIDVIHPLDPVQIPMVHGDSRLRRHDVQLFAAILADTHHLSARASTNTTPTCIAGRVGSTAIAERILHLGAQRNHEFAPAKLLALSR